jgi:hypothetical protein
MITKIENLALQCAREAIEQGAVAPWGDGDMEPGDLEALSKLLDRQPTREEVYLFEQAFRSAIDTLEVIRAVGQARKDAIEECAKLCETAERADLARDIRALKGDT